MAPKRLFSEIDNGVADNGTHHSRFDTGMIESLYLENFMCHKRYEVYFDPGINFIVGENGSGKSCIITALQVALGASASSTSRGSSTSSLIMTGKPSALVRVRFCNTGVDAYRPNDFGPAVVLERKLVQCGQSTYALKTVSGALISNKKADVECMLSQYNISIDSPCTCMTQDMSREFLAAVNNKKLFQFFRDSTHINKMLHNYAETTQFRAEVAQIILRKGQQLADKKKQLDELKSLVTLASEVRDMEQKMGKLGELFAWASVCRGERKVRELELQAKEKKDSCDLSKGKCEELKQRITDGEAERKELTAKLSEKAGHCEEQAKELEQLKEKLTQMKNTTMKFAVQAQAHRSAIDAAKRAIAKAQNDLEELQQSGMEASAADQNACRARKAELQEKVTAANADLVQRSGELRNLQFQVNALEQEKQRHEYDIKDQENDIREKQKRKQQLEDMRIGKLRSMGSHVERLVDASQRHRSQFSMVPLGPVGALIRLNDDQWAGAVEACIGASYLHRFLLNDNQDEKVLFHICDQLGIQRPGVTIFPYTRIKHPTPKSRGSYILVSEILELDRGAAQQWYPDLSPDMVEATMFNFLVDWREIDLAMVMNDRKTAAHVMFNERPHVLCRQTGLPKAVAMCYLNDGSRLFRRGQSNVEDYQNRQARFLGVSPDKELAVIVTDITRLANRLSVVKESYKATEQQWRSLEAQRRQLHMEVGRMQRQVRQLECETQDVDLELQQATQQQQQQQQDAMLLDLQDRIRAKRTEIAQLEVKLGEAEARHQDAEKAVQPLQEELNAKDSEKRESEAELRRQKTRLEQLLPAIQRDNAKLERFEEQYAAAQAKLAEAQNAVDAERNALAELTTKALEVCPRVETERAVEDIAAERRQLQQQVEKQKKMTTKSQVQLQQEYKQSIKSYDALETRFAKIKQAQANLTVGLTLRRHKLQKIEKNIRKAWGLRFNNILTKKGHSGHIVFDDEKEEVILKVHLNSAQAAGGYNTVTNMKTLSGGEKSFTTLAMCTALWSFAESPVRCMDEFDVFMDDVYRKKSLDMLCEVCSNTPGHQYIFLTPQGIEHVDKRKYQCKCIRIHKADQRSLDSFVGQPR